MPAQNPNANRSETVRPKPAKKKVVGKVKSKPPAAKQVKQAQAQEQQYKSQGHSVRLQANPQRGTSPSGDRPQGRSQAMDRAPSHRTMAKDPNTGREVSTLKTPPAPRGSQQRGTSPAGDRPQGRAKEMREAPTRARVKKGHGPGTVLATISPTKLAGKYVAAVNWKDPRGKISGGIDLATNAGMDAAELGVTAPSSVAKIVSTAATHPKKLPGMLAQPYIDLAKDPKKAITEHPVSTALMVAPAVRIPGRVVGKAARVAGKQTLARPAATLPGTALKEARTGSRDVVVRAVQSRADKKEPNPVMSQADVERRVDEFHDFGKQHTARVVDSAAAQAKKTAKVKGLSKDERKQAVQEKIEGARGGARHQVDERFAREFGSTWHVADDGRTIVRPKAAAEGVLHESKDNAQRIADKLNERDKTVSRGHHSVLQRPRQNSPKPLTFVVRPAGEGKYAVVPKTAADRLKWHQNVGTSQAPGSKLMRVAGRTFRTAVLPLSARWLTGQVAEAGIRAVVAGSGPADLLRMRQVVRRMNKEKPGSGDELAMRITGGQFGMTGTAREFAEGRSLADEFEGTALEDIAHGVTKAGNTRSARAVRAGWQKYTHVVFNTVNGAIENTARKAMAGHAIRQGAFMEHHVIGLSDKAIADAASGLRGSHAQVELGRAVDRMYGQYQKFSPAKRETLLHTTPFYPWYRNVLTFLTKTLPVDHPIKAALLADVNVIEEDWRKLHGLSLRQGGHKPGFLLGSYPIGKDGRVVRFGRYTPAAPGDAYGSLADLVTPQFGNVKEILKGHDFAGRDIKGNRGLVAVKSLVEAHIPGAGQLDRLTGIGGHYIDKTGEPTVLRGKKVLPALRREFDPLIGTKAPKKPSSGRVVGRLNGTGGDGGGRLNGTPGGGGKLN